MTAVTGISAAQNAYLQHRDSRGASSVEGDIAMMAYTFFLSIADLFMDAQLESMGQEVFKREDMHVADCPTALTVAHQGRENPALHPFCQAS